MRTRFPDVIIALDGNFQHRHYKSVLDDPVFLETGDSFGWVTAEEVAQAKAHVDECKKEGGSNQIKRRSSSIPSQVLDDCESSYRAAQEKLKESDDSAYDIKGVMAMVCAHNVPLAIANIKTFGEPRYLAVALLRKLDSMLPSEATIGVMYDIGDQLDRTIEKVSFFSSLVNRA
jgi:hypothetical protein